MTALRALPFFAALGLLACSGESDPISASNDPTNPAGASSSGGSTSSSSSSGATSSSGGSSASSSSGGPSSSSGGSSSGSSSGNPTLGPTTRFGALALVSNAYDAVEIGAATSTFQEVPGLTNGAAACTTLKEGACDITTCVLPEGPGGAGTKVPVRYTDAGVVLVTGIKGENATLTLTPAAAGYAPVNGNTAFFTGGESIRLRAPGQPMGAPAFDVTLVAPSAVNVTAPPFDEQGRVTAKAGKTLGVAWVSAPSPTSDIVVQMVSSTAQKSAQARCTFAAASQAGSIPAAVFTALAGVGGTSTSFVVSSTAHKTIASSGWDVTVDLQAYGLRPGPAGTTLATGTLTIQ